MHTEHQKKTLKLTLLMQEGLNLRIHTSDTLMEKQAKNQNSILELLLAHAVRCLANLMIT